MFYIKLKMYKYEIKFHNKYTKPQKNHNLIWHLVSLFCEGSIRFKRFFIFNDSLKEQPIRVICCESDYIVCIACLIC